MSASSSLPVIDDADFSSTGIWKEEPESDEGSNDDTYDREDGVDAVDEESAPWYTDDSIDNIDIEVKQASPQIAQIFDGGIVRWTGSKNARYVLLVDTPKQEDLRSGVLDSSGKLRRLFCEIIDELPLENQGELAIVSCLVGWTATPYRKEGTPYANELNVSVAFLERVLLQMPNLQTIITLGQYATELCYRRFDIYDMYGKSRKHGALTKFDAPSPSMFLRRTYDKFFTTTVGNVRALRYMCAPPTYHRDFRAFVLGCLYQVNKVQQFTIEHTNFDVRDPALSLTEEDVRGCTDYRGFKESMYARLRREREEGVRSVFNDAGRDPCGQVGSTRNLLVYDVEYDAVKNVMYMHTGTPSGTPMRVAMNNLTFTFWIRPHPAFDVQRNGRWPTRENGLELNYNDNLAPLQKFLYTKLYYRMQERAEFVVKPKNLIGAVPALSLMIDKEKDDNFDGKWKDGQLTGFIRCEVNNHAYIETVRVALSKLHAEYVKTMRSNETKVAKGTDLKKFYDERLDFYDIYTAEKMFINRYNVRMSHWYRVSVLDVDPPKPLSHKHGVLHSLYLSATLSLPRYGNAALECLPPDKSLPLDYDGMTSSDMAEDVRGSFDIEVAKFGKDFGTYLNTPIICICVVVRRHSNKTTTLEKTTCIPDDGYEYFGFTLGAVQGHRDDSELRGNETLFTFTSEREMLRSYYKFYDMLKPRYYASHNGKAFDHPFCMRRASLIGCKRRVLGYVPDQTVRLVQKQFDSRAFGERTVSSYDGEKGIVQMDTLEILMREKKLESYRLGFVAKTYIKMTKNDMPYNAIMGHWRESDWSRRVLLDYCYRDAQLPDQILSQGQWIVNVNELARANGSVSEGVMHERGVQEKIQGAYAIANNTIGNRYLVRTNNYKVKQENEKITERWAAKEDYLQQSIFAALDNDKSSVVASQLPKKRPLDDSDSDSDGDDVVANDKSLHDAKVKARSTLPRNKRAIPAKRARTNPVRCAHIATFFEAAAAQTLLSKEKPKGSDDELEDDVHIPGLNLSEKEKRLKALSALAKAKIAGREIQRKADYQGAVVMNAILGWHYKLPLGCMDFASLYPSIMMAFNMGSNTKVYGDELLARGYTLEDVYEPAKTLRVKNPRTGAMVRLYFLKETICEGIVALMENTLVKLRNVAKVLIEPYGNEFLEDNVTPNPQYNPALSAIMKQRSDGLKIMANSGYGSMGASGLLCDKDIAAAVTACGREAITLVRDKTIKRFGAICRGGDTDSVFMEFPGLPKGSFEKRWARVCEKARLREESSYDGPVKVCCPLVPDGWYRCNTVADIEALADGGLMSYLNKFFKRPMKLEYEKAMCRFVAIAKKRYIYFMCIRGKVPFLNYKGLEVIRRDSLPITKRTMKAVFEILQFLRDPLDTDEQDQAKIDERKKRACEYIRQQAEKLANGDVTIDDLIMSKQRSREYYSNENQEHLTVVKKTEERGLDPTPVGSRVYYVYTHMCDAEGRKTRKGFEITDDPEWVIENDVPIDYLYYLEHKFKDPIVRVMRYFLYDDMVEKVLKRKRDQTTLDEHFSSSSSAKMRKGKRAKTEDQRQIDVTLDDITKATEEHLFGAAKKGSYLHKNLQTRYASLRGSKVATAHVDKEKRSGIAHYAQSSRTRLQHLKVEYETEDDTTVLNKEIDRFEKTRNDYDTTLHDCRKCLKIGDDKDVECSAYDCNKFYPRITARGRHMAARRDLEELVREFTDLRVAVAKTGGHGEELGRAVGEG